MKKLLLGLCLGILSVAGFSQTGLQGVFVEKLYVATAADHALDPNLPVGAVTYRVFLDLNTGWRLASIFGDPDNAQNIVIKTSSPNGFYNVSLANGGKRYGHEINYASLATGTLKFDTWFAFGGAAAPAPPNYYHGIVKSGANPNGIITLTTPTTRLTQTSPASDMVDFLYPILDGTSTNNDFTSPNIGFYDLLEANYVQGPDANNHVLLGQFTTDGDFSYQFNILLYGPAPASVREIYVAEYPADATQLEFPALKGTAVPPIPPTVSGLTVNPVDVIVGAHVALSVTATDDAPGSVSKVEFFRGTTLLTGTVTNAGDVYSLDYVTDVVGTFNITAVATDNENNSVTTSPVSLTVRSVPSNIPPVVNSLTVPATVNIGSIINGSATASDADGTIASVQFYVNNIAVGTPDASSPYEFTYTAPATEQILAIKAVATDNQGAQSADRIVNVTVENPDERYEIPNQTVNCNGSDLFYVPVVKKGGDISYVIGFDMVMGFNQDKVLPTGVVLIDTSLVANSSWTSYALRVQGDSVYISLFFNGTAPADTYFAGRGNVLSVEFAKKPAFDYSDSVTFGVNDFVESYNTGTLLKSVTSGTFTTVQDLTFTGSLKFWADNSPIVYVAGANLISEIRSCDWSRGPVSPDALGNFDWALPAANALSINVKRDIANTTDVIAIIGGYDAYLTQKVLVNDRNFKPNVYQMIAMDVNQDGKISAGDLSQIMQRAALKIGEFKQVFNYDNEGNQILPARASWDWTFVSNRVLFTLPYSRISTTYPDEDGAGFTKNHLPSVGTCIALNVDNFGTCPVIYDEEFLGIMLGDVDGSYKDIAPNPLTKSAQAFEKSGMTDDKVVFDLSKATLSNGYLTFPISVSSETNVNSLDFSMQFDLSKLSFESVFNHSNNLQSLAYYNESDKTLRLTSFSLQNYAKDAAVVSLRFKVNSENLSSEDISSVNGYLNGSPAKVEITELALGGTENIDRIIKIYPNPARDFINVELSENADIEIIDILGRTVSVVKDVMAYQKHEINVERLPQGTYIMKIKMKIGDQVFVSIQKVVIKK